MTWFHQSIPFAHPDFVIHNITAEWSTQVKGYGTIRYTSGHNENGDFVQQSRSDVCDVNTIYYKDGERQPSTAIVYHTENRV